MIGPTTDTTEPACRPLGIQRGSAQVGIIRRGWCGGTHPVGVSSDIDLNQPYTITKMGAEQAETGLPAT